MTTAFHPIMLCQPDSGKSCGACCGLYNWHDHSSPALAGLMEMQTQLFLALDDYTRLEQYRERRNKKITNAKLFDTIYNCEFLGFVDADHCRVGCMLHPEVTGRPELRNNCFYGAKICNEHFCPSFSCLTTPEQRAVVRATDDWYLYGLAITDIDFVKEFFRHVENRLGESIKEQRLEHPDIQAVLREFFQLKQKWPFTSGQRRLGKYYFSEAEYMIARIEYRKRWNVDPSRFDKILVSLESDFSSKQELQAAEDVIEGLVQKFLSRYEP
ncbi:hypothetical protein ACFL43_06110 [Thermodesulfobacteriota bacterium]